MGDAFPEDLAARYEPVRPLASGGMATVWLATQRDLNREVAVKLLHERVFERSTERERFVNEARITAGLSHPNIVKVLDFGAATGVPWIVYEYLPGESLADLLSEGGLSLAETLSAAAQVAAALAEAHQHGILHRDVKPANVLCAEPGLYKVGDFGLARVLEGGTALTATGVVVGTPAFFAPELITGSEPVPATDLYALGVSLYQLLVNELPPLGVNAAVLWERAWQARATDLPPPLARKIGQVVGALLAPTKERRTASAAEARQQLADLAEAAAGETATAPAAATQSPPTPPAGRARSLSRSGRVRTLQPPTPLAGAPARRGHWLALPLTGLVALGAALSLRQPPPAPVATPTPSVRASAADRRGEVRAAARALSQAIDEIEERLVITSTPGLIGENVRQLANRRELEPLLHRNLENARRLVRLMRELKQADRDAEVSLRIVSRVIAQGANLQMQGRDPALQRAADLIRTEAEALAREAPGSGFVGAGVSWVRAKHAGLAGRAGDAEALRHLRTAVELLQAEPDPAWQSSKDFADTVLQTVHAAHQHVKRMESGRLIDAHADPADQRESALEVLRAVQRCLDLKSDLGLRANPAVAITAETAADVLGSAGSRPAERALAYRVGRQVLQLPRPSAGEVAAAWDALSRLCPSDKAQDFK